MIHFQDFGSRFVNTGNAQFTNSAVGTGSTVNNVMSAAPFRASQENEHSNHGNAYDVGVVTILPEETRAVRDALLLEQRKVDRLFFYQGTVDVGGSQVRVVAVQTHGQGQRSAMAACENLRRRFAPSTLALVGVGGGISPEQAAIGDVVVATRVVYYDRRKENPGITQRRGEERESPAEIGHAVNAFFSNHGAPARLSSVCSGGESRPFKAVPGLVASGEAVIADRDSEIRSFLHRYNDKILAVDMEAGGLSQFWQENSVNSEPNPGWVVIRGISDHADEEKGHAHHTLAANNAAAVLRALIPYLH
ncbi:5'-methylthioadenosine/S-adenosylhomocysteine nucleosidase family protein [Marinitenerispora sediminis]|uniref:Nucleoside phosphorylase domain-containing protein n=1 Tax=Marinitenerispora sediminis TaxID=1931232 RepID=A0A368T3W3_9ACTN|nr:hypothetical protein [Marinitenerispora sediminis]RCV50994.1 hypothetical protein DEF28_16555 [Marinitenerispora sediminis]RCV52488.1 hypothetical protein DEF24_21925 [Marinitenerispora sediminis]RCV53839.1 hypothetical protein DEF23_16885 [Marinitenerispora sediminis]